MASSSSHNNNNNGIPLATQLEWYKIRDTFFGDNEVFKNIRLALELASSCQHPDALELGYAVAEALMADRTRGEEKFKFAKLAAAQGERGGFPWLGVCFYDGQGCERDWDKAKENFLFASELGHFGSSMLRLGGLLDECDPQRWRWWGRAAALGESWSFVSFFSYQVKLFNSGSGSAAVVFAIGRALNGHVNEQARTIFNDGATFNSLIGPAKQAIAFYDAQIKATKDAMYAWTQVGIRWKVVKDVRKLIAKLIWDSKEEALYNVLEGPEQGEEEEQQSVRASHAQKRARK